MTLERGDDLAQLARDAIGRGADVIGMAGGDGSQALVADIASEHDVPFVCIPAGTRNHFALDLGVDRDDVVGALDAFTDGYERRVDLARVNGRVFVNNVSFGVYAAIVQSDEYRDAKLNTAAKMLPELLGSDYDPFDFELDGPPAVASCDPDLILVSNNVYKLEGIGGLGTRERLDEGVLGVIVVEVHNGAELAQLVSLSTAGRRLGLRGMARVEHAHARGAVGQADRHRHRRRGGHPRLPGAARGAAGRAAGPHRPASSRRVAGPGGQRGAGGGHASTHPHRVRRLTPRHAASRRVTPARRRESRRLASSFRSPGLGAPARAPGPHRAADGEPPPHGRSRNLSGGIPGPPRSTARPQASAPPRKVVGIVTGVLAVAAVGTGRERPGAAQR